MLLSILPKHDFIYQQGGMTGLTNQPKKNKRKLLKDQVTTISAST